MRGLSIYIYTVYSCTVTKLDNTMMMHSRAEKDTPRHGTVQNGTARVSTHDSTTDVCAGAHKALQAGHSQVPALYQPLCMPHDHSKYTPSVFPMCCTCVCVCEGEVGSRAGWPELFTTPVTSTKTTRLAAG